ncbi:MAG: hypothetical protein IPI60_18565 [Saprospiraceae bacterium]|nr:hypothetical protein [Saprospiraceae bacterium]
MTNKTLLGALAGGISLFLLGWLIYGMLLMDYTTANFNQCAANPPDQMIWWSMIVSCLSSGLLLALILSWSNQSGAAAGTKIGAVVGALIALSVDLNMHSMSSMFSGLTPLLVDVLAYTAMMAIGGAVVGLVMRK